MKAFLWLLMIIWLTGCATPQGSLQPNSTTLVKGSGSYQTLVRLDQAGQPHLVFAVAGGQAALHYRQPDGRDEVIVRFDHAERTEFEMAFQLDTEDRPVVAYAQDGLWLARRLATGWVHEQIDPVPSRGYFPSLALGSDGSSHVSYFDLAQNDLHYVTNQTGAWQRHIVDARGRPGFHLAAGFNQLTLACQLADYCQHQQPVIVYLAYRYKPYDGELRVARMGADGWMVETIDAARGTGGFPSLGVTPEGGLWVSYYRASTWDFAYGELRIARRDHQGWRYETLATGTYVGRYQALALNAEGQPHILYTGVDGQATMASFCNGWRHVPIASPSAIGWISFALEGNGSAWATLTTPTAETALLKLDLHGKDFTCL